MNHEELFSKVLETRAACRNAIQYVGKANLPEREDEAMLDVHNAFQELIQWLEWQLN